MWAPTYEFKQSIKWLAEEYTWEIKSSPHHPNLLSNFLKSMQLRTPWSSSIFYRSNTVAIFKVRRGSSEGVQLFYGNFPHAETEVMRCCCNAIQTRGPSTIGTYTIVNFRSRLRDLELLTASKESLHKTTDVVPLQSLDELLLGKNVTFLFQKNWALVIYSAYLVKPKDSSIYGKNPKNCQQAEKLISGTWYNTESEPEKKWGGVISEGWFLCSFALGRFHSKVRYCLQKYLRSQKVGSSFSAGLLRLYYTYSPLKMNHETTRIVVAWGTVGWV